MKELSITNWAIGMKVQARYHHVMDWAADIPFR
jgi:hypothetical protein